MKKRISFQLWPFGLLMTGAAFIAFMAAVVTVAFKHPPQLVSKRYYEQGFNLKDIVGQEMAGEASGWKLSIEALPHKKADMPVVELNVLESDGRPADSLAGTLSFYRPSDSALDIPACPLRYAGQGRYLVFPPHPLDNGSWQANAELHRGKSDLHARLNFFVDD